MCLLYFLAWCFSSCGSLSGLYLYQWGRPQNRSLWDNLQAPTVCKTMCSGKPTPPLRRRTTHTPLTHHEGGFVVEKHSTAQPGSLSLRATSTWKQTRMSAAVGVCRRTVSSVWTAPSSWWRWVVSSRWVLPLQVHVCQCLHRCVCVCQRNLQQGQTWSQSGNRCELFTCVKHNETLNTITSHIICPPFVESNCEPVSICVCDRRRCTDCPFEHGLNTLVVYFCL